MSEFNQSDRQSFLESVGIYSAAGIQLALSVVIGLFLGNYFDQVWGTTPWLTIVGLLVGSVGGFWNFLRILNWHRDKNRHDC